MINIPMERIASDADCAKSRHLIKYPEAFQFPSFAGTSVTISVADLLLANEDRACTNNNYRAAVRRQRYQGMGISLNSNGILRDNSVRNTRRMIVLGFLKKVTMYLRLR